MEQITHTHDNEIDNFIKNVRLPKESLFVADVDLWPIYIESFEAGAVRQYHNCNTCKRFIQNYGGLVTIDPKSGKTVSAIWNPDLAPTGYESVFIDMSSAVEKALVKKVFISSDRVLGTPVTGEWTHFALNNPNVYVKRALTAGQFSAEKKEDYRNISRALAGFKLETLEQVTELLESDSLYRSEKILGQAVWLFLLKTAIKNEKHQQHRKNIIWKAIADAPTGFCHPRSGMIGTLLDDLDNGLSFNDAASRFKAKMHPLQYQRPTAEPTEGAIVAAQKKVEDLGVTPSLERKFATLGDLQTIWKPGKTKTGNEGRIFDNLKQNKQTKVMATAGNITWLKFASEVLPKAKKIEIEIPHGRSAFTNFLTALDDEAPIIFQWDNAVSWYNWHGGSTASHYGLSPGWSDVDAVCFPPYMWGEKNLSNFKDDVVFIIHGARESRNQGNALFPETLKSEFHSIRGVIEAHSRKTKIHDIEGAHAVGKGLGSKVRVHTSVVTEYTIDRWD